MDLPMPLQLVGTRSRAIRRRTSKNGQVKYRDHGVSGIARQLFGCT